MPTGLHFMSPVFCHLTVSSRILGSQGREVASPKWPFKYYELELVTELGLQVGIQFRNALGSAAIRPKVHLVANDVWRESLKI